MQTFEWTAAKNTMRTTAKVKIKKSRPYRKLRYGRKPTLCISNSASHTSLKKRHALTNNILNFINIDKIALVKGIVTERLGNVTITAHSLDVGTVGAVMAANFVVSLSVTNYER